MTFYVELETTEGNRVGKIVKVTEEAVDLFVLLCNSIREFKPYELQNSRMYSISNFPMGSAVRTELGEKTIEQLYPDIVPDVIREFIETFKIFSGYDADIHRICRIQEVIFGRTLIVE